MRPLDKCRVKSDAEGPPIPISLSRTRLKLRAFAILAVLSAFSDLPGWVTPALLLVCAAIPLAVWTLWGPESVRALFLPPPRSMENTPEKE
ncbi:hypothetical protein Misp01_05290 [Microtetraspora sp. NBRC 13810]|uniref:hypothetical protein n=1 Tax=Microtetraspora sp. NBRC 13810 TaxID=3030990 RepID=UPI0024A03245|nr:hypothetical protein [Microtetraspora sp. NBRC 13810]GLW05399.1 hypothetical protein Misp01_05290 [Microtetraspora sp. NBRC 13810]